MKTLRCDGYRAALLLPITTVPATVTLPPAYSLSVIAATALVLVALVAVGSPVDRTSH